MKVKARIKVFNGGRYGRTGEYIAIVNADTKKNGEIYKTKFKVLEVLSVVKHGYNYGTATQSESIAEVLEVLEG